MKIVDDDGQLLDVARRAWDSGVVMDIGHGTGSFAYATAEALIAAGRAPGRDLDRPAPALDQRPRLRPADDDEQVPPPRACRCEDVVRATTSRPAEILGLDGEVGTLRPGCARGRRALPPAARPLPALRHLGRDARGGRAARQHAHDRRRAAARAAAAAGARAVGAEPIWPELQKEFTDRLQAMRDRGHTPRPAARGGRGRAGATERGRARRPASARQRAALDDGHGVREVDRGADVVRHDRDAVADAHLGVRRDGDDAVLLAEADDVPVVVAPDRRRTTPAGRERASGRR